MAGGIPRMNLHLRVQHGLLAVLVAAALATGFLLRRPLAGAVDVHAWHLAAGLGSLALLGYHLLYLAVRGYVESRGWGSFALRWGAADLAAVLGEARHVLAGAPERPEAGEFRVSQKALYWWTLAATAALGATGLGIAFWESIGSLSALPQLVVLHRGFALLLFAAALWHLYGVLTWEGRWSPEWSWFDGMLDAQKAQRKVPGAYRLQLAEEAARLAAGQSVPADEKIRVRQIQEKEEVQDELERGNRLALEERYVEALYHYRRALELYPGYSQALYNMARVLVRLGDREMARETYREFLEADPFHPLARKAQEAIRELADAGDPQ